MSGPVAVTAAGADATLYPSLTWAELLGMCRERAAAGALRGAADNSQTPGGDGFRVTRTFAECLGLLENGWLEGAAKMAAADLQAPAGDPDRDWHLSVAGFFPEVGAYVAGEPECMFRLDVNPEARRRVRVFVPTGYSAYLSTEFLMEYAYALAAYVRGLEATGASVSVVAVDTSTRHSECNREFHVRPYEVKRYDEPMMLARIAFVGHPDFLRRVVFAVRERTPGAEAIAKNCYGYSHNIPPKVQAAIYAHADKDVLDGSDARVYVPHYNALESAKIKDAAGILKAFTAAPFIDGALSPEV